MLENLYDGSSLSSRQVSGFPISLPTGLSLESIFPRRIAAYDPDRKIPQVIDLANYQECWISLSTLFRNMVSSMSTEAAARTTAQEYRDEIETEIDVINGLFMNEGNNLCRPKYYICSYKSLKGSIPPQILLREDKTDGQRAYTKKHDEVMKLLLKTNDVVMDFDMELKSSAKSAAFILTHRPWDLLSHRNFSKLDLLESNTGRLKTKYHWNTKYYPVGSSDMSVLPFNRRLLLLFGDRVQIHPSDMKLRRAIVETAHKYKWSALTGEQKMMMDLQLSINEPFVIEFISKL